MKRYILEDRDFHPEVIAEVLWMMRDSLKCLEAEFSEDSGQAYYSYVDTKLGEIERGCKYFRSLFEEED